MQSLSRRRFMQVLAAGSAAALACQSRPTRKPNIIYILADDLGYGDLGCYGQKEIKTPNLDRMAAQGRRFTDHYSGSTVCAPSRCCLMTGYHTGHARIRGNGGGPLMPEDITAAEILAQVGYKTALIGKWGLGEANTTGVPNQQGFDYFFGYLNQIRAHNFYTDWLWKNNDKVQLDNEIVMQTQGYAAGIGSAAKVKKEYSHDLFTEQALQFVRDNRQQPFFLYLAYTIPHANNESQRLIDEHGMEVPDYGLYADKDWPEPQKGHAAMITRMDRDIGTLLDVLEQLGLAENTLVMFSSDNGPHREGGNDPGFNDSNGPLRGIKRDLYEGGIRVPFIAWWPGTIDANTTSHHVSAFWDVLPTVAEIAGADIPKGIDGLSMLPALQGNEAQQAKHEYLYWEFHEGQASKQAIRKDKWKFISLRPGGPFELYELEKDLGEQNDLSQQYPELIDSFKALLEKARTPDKEWPLRGA